MNNQIFNDFIDKLVLKADEIGKYYNYPDNITHLLYLILPAFILKYGLNQESYIIDCFTNIPILINDTENTIYQAYYTSRPILKSNEFDTYKGIVLRNYKNISLMQLLDNLIHEFNHAINSIYQELRIVDNYIYVRTGLTNIIYDRETLNSVKKEDTYILEEIINTKQTEMIIDIIHSFNKYEINNTIINNTLYSIHHSINNNFKSNAYLLQSFVCKTLLENKTFFSTIENLRLYGNIWDIDDWFNTITGDANSYKALIDLLNELVLQQQKLKNNKIANYFTINRIKNINKRAMEIVNKFDNNCNYR